MRSIKTHLTVILLLCILLPTGLIGAASCLFILKNIVKHRLEDTGQIAEVRYQTMRERLLEDNQRSKSLLNELIADCRYSDAGINVCVRPKLEQFISINHALGISFHSGIEHDLNIGKDVITRAQLIQPLLPKQIAVTSTSKLTGESLFSLLTIDSASEFSLVTTYSGQALQSIFVNSPMLGQSGETFLADNQGFFITKPRYTSSEQGVVKPISVMPMQHCLNKENGEMLSLDYRNIPIIHGFRFVPEIGGGCIMAHIDQHEAFGSLWQLVIGLMLAAVLFMCGAWLVARIISRNMTTQLIALTEMAEALSVGDFSKSMALETRYEEINVLSQLFNCMSRQLNDTLNQLKASEQSLEKKVLQRTAELHQQYKKYHSIIKTVGEGFWMVDKDGRLLEVNATYAKLSGYSEKELIGMRFSDLEARETPEETATHIQKIMQQGTDTFETQHRRKDGSIWDVDVNVSFINDGNQYFVAFFRDITERKQIELELHIAAIAFQSQDPIVITDTKGTILRINKAFAESTGYTEEDAMGKKISILKSGRHDKNFYVAIWESILRSGAWQGEVWDRRKNGEIYPKWLSITAVKTSDGRVTHYVGTHIDITERKSAEEQIKQLAFYDPLTQLPNRRLLQERLKHRINSEQRSGRKLALLMLDLDRFKAVNDNFGHLAGDELLQQVAQRITSRLRNIDTVARLGGDEFVILLEKITNSDDAARVAEDIIADLSKPFKLTQSDDVQIGTSIGISLYPEHGEQLEILMDRADTALYQAKDQGRGCFAYYSEALTNAARERIALETRLRRAIEQQELQVFYQPQVDIASGRIIGAEAVVRWQDPIEGLILPARFIAIAEETGLIISIGHWILQETCKQGRQWLDAGLPPLTLAVNVSLHQFRRSDMCALVAAVLAETNFPAQQLELEITENVLMGNQNDASSFLNNLHDQGIRLAIDHFGTGYSSLADLKQQPLNVLKIDQSFIDDIPFHQDDMEIAASIIAIGHIMGLKVLAKGVETAEQLAFLREKGCDSYQGYLKSKPITADKFAELLSEQNSNVTM